MGHPVYIGMGFVALKKSFLSILVCDLASEDSWTPFTGQNIFVFKVPFVETLNLCLKMPDTEEKTRNQSDHQELRKRPKTADICRVSKIGVFHQFFDVFSVKDGRIEFSSFALCQTSWDTSLEYPQRVLWGQKYFDL